MEPNAVVAVLGLQWLWHSIREGAEDSWLKSWAAVPLHCLHWLHRKQSINTGLNGKHLMVVKTQCIGHLLIGLEVGASNADRYFPREATEIELLLDHLRIQCWLPQEFWSGRAEILDPRLSAWLEQKGMRGRAGERTVPLSMIPSGKNAFRLQPIGRHTKDAVRVHATSARAA